MGIGWLGCGDDSESATTDPDPLEEPRHGLTAEEASAELLKIGDTVITVGQFADRLADQSPYLRARYNSPERRREFLQNLVRFELLAEEARRRDLDELPEVERTRNQMMIQQMMRELFEDQGSLADISDEEIAAFYREHASEFQKPAQVRATHIMIADRTLAQRVLTDILRRPEDVRYFRQMAEEHNQDPATRDRFGDLRFFSRPSERPEDEVTSVPDAVAEAAFAVEGIGNVHPELVPSDGGFHIVKLTGRRAALNRSLEEARRPIQNRLWRERREQRIEDFVEGLREDATVEINEELLSTIRVNPVEGDVPAVPTDMPATPLIPPPLEGSMSGNGNAAPMNGAPSTMAPGTTMAGEQ
ncbi:MAG: peptidyl-prolyl cis-trans isomerase [Myxococcota bacterium]